MKNKLPKKMEFKLEKLVRPNIQSLQPYASARDEFTGNEGIFLDANENPFGSLNRYPDPYQRRLKQALSRVKNVPVQKIFIGNGSDEVIDLALRIFCRPNQDKVLTFSPTYGMYEVSANINDVEIIKEELGTDFQIDRSRLSPYFLDEEIKIIFICSPNNPTGNCIRSEDIEYILNNFSGIVIIDEAYIDFAEQASWSLKLADFPNLIVSQTFSKAYGLAAARVGTAFMSEEILHYFNKVKPPYNVSSLSQKAALEVLNDDKKRKKELKILQEEKRKLADALASFPFVKKIFPSDTNFLLAQVEDANSLYDYLTEQKIIVRNRTKVVENALRFTVGSPSENQSLKHALNSFKTEIAQ